MALFDASRFSNINIPHAVMAEANSGIDRLRVRLVDEIDQSCLIPHVLLQSIVQAFFQGQIRRGLMFIEGGYDAYLAHRGLVAYTCARAVYETFACVMDFCDKLTDHLAGPNFEKTAAFLQARLFAARTKDLVWKEIMLKEVVDNTAVSILTQIDRASKYFPGLRDDYDHLCERTHPNGLGALHHFWASGDDIIKLSNDVDQDHVIHSLLRAGWLLAKMEDGITVMETKLANLPPF